MTDIIHRLSTKAIIIRFKLPRMFGIRMWLTIKILQLAGIVSPTTIEILHDDESDRAYSGGYVPKAGGKVRTPPTGGGGGREA